MSLLTSPIATIVGAVGTGTSFVLAFFLYAAAAYLLGQGAATGAGLDEALGISGLLVVMGVVAVVESIVLSPIVFFVWATSITLVHIVLRYHRTGTAASQFQSQHPT